MMLFDYSDLDDLGSREQQEDHRRFLPLSDAKPTRGRKPGDPQSLLAVLADGMGGHAGGYHASHIACGAFQDAFLKGDRAAGRAPRSSEDYRKWLREGLVASNREIASRVQQNGDLQGMGCTLVGARFGARGLLWISVGDSPLYLVRRGEVKQLNEDHSLGSYLDAAVARGEMSRDEASKHPQRNALRSAVTGAKIDHYDSRQDFLALQPGDLVILASDGIKTLSVPEIGEVVNRSAKLGAHGVAQSLIGAVKAKALPHQDNTTVMVVRPYDSNAKSNSKPLLVRPERPTVIIEQDRQSASMFPPTSVIFVTALGIFLALGVVTLLLFGLEPAPPPIAGSPASMDDFRRTPSPQATSTASSVNTPNRDSNLAANGAAAKPGASPSPGGRGK